MIDAATRHRHAVVIGGGLLGLEGRQRAEAARYGRHGGTLGSWLLERQLDEVAGKMLQKSLEDRGLRFLPWKKQTEALIRGESGRVAAIPLQDGMQIPSRPRGDGCGHTAQHHARRICWHLLQSRNRGQLDTMQTYDPKMPRWGMRQSPRNRPIGLVAPLFEQAKVAANHLGAMASAATRVP